MQELTLEERADLACAEYGLYMAPMGLIPKLQETAQEKQSREIDLMCAMDNTRVPRLYDLLSTRDREVVDAYRVRAARRAESAREFLSISGADSGTIDAAVRKYMALQRP